MYILLVAWARAFLRMLGPTFACIAAVAALAGMAAPAACKELPHYGHTTVKLKGGKAILCHHITGEELELAEGYTAVAYNAKGYGYVDWPGSSAWFADMLQSSAHASGHKLFMLNHTTGVRSWVSSELPEPTYVPLKVGVGQRVAPIKCCRIPWYTPSLGLWWVLRDFQAPFGLCGRTGASDHNQGCKWVLDSIPAWEAAFGKLFGQLYPSHLLLKRAISRNRGSQAHWSKVLDDHAASTHGLLLVCLHRAHLARPVSLRPHAVEVLEAFITEFFKEEAVEVNIDMAGEEVDFAIGLPPSGATVAAVPVDEGMVWLQPMLAKAPRHVKAQLMQVLGLNLTPPDQVPPCMDLSKVLLLSWNHGVHWFLGQWLNQIAAMVGIIYEEKGYTSNPLDVTAGFDWPAGRRHDKRLVETLALGRAPSGVDAVSCHPEQHLRTFSVLSRRLKAGPACFDRVQSTILNKYLDVGRQHFSMCRVVTLAIDGSRFTGRDTCIGMLCGKHAATGDWAAMWCPPQAQQS